jgi:hypothetical protein
VSHASLKRSVRDALRKRGCLVTSNPTGGGVLDLTVCTPDGRYIELDIKVERDKLSRLQEYRIAKVRWTGGAAGEVRSVDEALKFCGLLLASEA